MTVMIVVKLLETDSRRFDGETSGPSPAVGRRLPAPLGGTAAIPVIVVDEPAVQVVVHRLGHRHREVVIGHGATGDWRNDTPPQDSL